MGKRFLIGAIAAITLSGTLCANEYDLKDNMYKLNNYMMIMQAGFIEGDKQKALSYYRKALELSPDSAQTRQKVATLENTLAPPSR